MEKNVPYLEITEVVLIHVILLKMVINKIQDSCIHLFPETRSVNYLMFHLKNLFFKKLLIQNFFILNYGLQIKTLIL